MESMAASIFRCCEDEGRVVDWTKCGILVGLAEEDMEVIADPGDCDTKAG